VERTRLVSVDYGTLAVGHEGASTATTCCAVVRLVALPSVATGIDSAARPYSR